MHIIDIAEEIDEETIVDRIFEAVVEQRLPAGTKLSEQALCEAFGVGRMRIRRALLLLASREVVDLHPNKGAYIASPTAEQAREIFEARMVLEPTIATIAAGRATPAEVAALKSHLEAESAAQISGNRRDAIRLSGQFHIMLAQMAGNGVMLRMVKELVTRTSLLIGIYGSAGVTNCRDDEHSLIADAFAAGDGAKAALLMQEHLEHIQSHLDLTAKSGGPVDLLQLFRKE
ncbi:GntR family transcriptional regulator [Pseudorhodobacter antarcticus]|jgi:DNA-binding GntR family transcriptional regulator|nr:GntR family transcriptional regulator [Pseudorhodobacter antarcticus]